MRKFILRMRPSLLVAALLCVTWLPLILLSPTHVSAAPAGPKFNFRRFANPVLAKADTTTSRSFSVGGIRGYGIVVLYFWHEDHSSLTRVDWDCTVKYGTRDYVAQECGTLVNGECQSVDASGYKAVTGTKLWPYRIDVLGFEQLDCTLTFTNGSAGDSVRIDAAMMTK